jgi:hypothetical protein
VLRQIAPFRAVPVPSAWGWPGFDRSYRLELLVLLVGASGVRGLARVEGHPQAGRSTRGTGPRHPAHRGTILIEQGVNIRVVQEVLPKTIKGLHAIFIGKALISGRRLGDLNPDGR